MGDSTPMTYYLNVRRDGVSSRVRVLCCCSIVVEHNEDRTVIIIVMIKIIISCFQYKAHCSRVQFIYNNQIKSKPKRQ